MEEDKSFSKQLGEKMKQSMLDQFEHRHDYSEDSFKHWRAWGSWFSWGSPVGLGLFFIEIGACIWLVHAAGLIK